ncbi:MAG: hypothetical protein CML50_23310 [Rhodobacteraceae bacterium]|nr:hypothetical protein [Paracoccaceae bacterium]
MVPNSALSLSFEGIALLRRADIGWRLVDEVALDRDDLEAALRELCETASASAPDGAEVLLILPDEQLRYLDIPAPSEDSRLEEAAVRKALDGATPYDVEELVYDWHRRDGRLQVAAAARETLDEAESFVRAHGFVPVSFTATPPHETFSGTVSFGAASGWTGEAPDRLPAPVQIVWDYEDLPPLNDDEAIQADESATAAGGSAESDADLHKSVPDAARSDASNTPAPANASPERASSEPRQAEAAALAPLPGANDATARPGSAPSAGAKPAPDAAVAQKQSTDRIPPAEQVQKPVSFGGGMFGPGGNARSDSESDAATEAPVVRPLKPASGPAAPRADGDAPAAPSFSSIRATRDAPAGGPAPLAAAPQVTPGNEPRVAPRLKAEAVTDSAAPTVGASATGSTAKTANTPKVATPSAAAPRKAETATTPAKAVPSTAETSTRSGAAEASATPRADAPKFQNEALRRVAMRRANGEDPGAATVDTRTVAAGTLDPEEERRRMTLFGARREEQIGGKPRFLGLMLTMALLVFLVGIAAWAAVFLDEGISRFFAPSESEDTTIAAAPPPETQDTPAPAEAPASLPADDAQAEDIAVLPPEPEAEPSEATALQPMEPVPGHEEPSPEEAAARYAATGIWQRAPEMPMRPIPDLVEDLYIASVDPKVGQFDAIALPPAPGLNEDVTLEPRRLPPGPDVRFDLDENGLVRAAPEGAISPDGHRVFTGAPPQVPPLRTPVETDDAPEAAEADAVDPAQDALREARPNARPEDLVEQNERATLGGNSIAELAAIRPVLRSPRVLEQAAAAPRPRTTRRRRPRPRKTPPRQRPPRLRKSPKPPPTPRPPRKPPPSPRCPRAPRRRSPHRCSRRAARATLPASWTGPSRCRRLPSGGRRHRTSRKMPTWRGRPRCETRSTSAG